MKNLSYKEHLIEKLKDPEYAAAYLEACLEESFEADDMGILMLAIRDVVEAHGGMGVVSSKMHVNRESFYKVYPVKEMPDFQRSRMLLELAVWGFRSNQLDFLA